MADSIAALRAALTPMGPPITITQISESEMVVGSRFPEVLKVVWVTIGTGVLLDRPHHLLPPSQAAREYQQRRSRRGAGWDWPAGLVPIAKLGCGITACVDTMATEAEVWWFDPNLDGLTPNGHAPPWRSQLDLHDWLVEFAAGSTFEDDWRMLP